LPTTIPKVIPMATWYIGAVAGINSARNQAITSKP